MDLLIDELSIKRFFYYEKKKIELKIQRKEYLSIFRVYKYQLLKSASIMRKEGEYSQKKMLKVLVFIFLALK